MVDPIMSDHLTDLMLRLKKELKLTSVVVTHDLDLLHRVADTVVFLSKGRVAFFGPPAELYKSEEPDIHEFLELDKVIRGGTRRRRSLPPGLAGPSSRGITTQTLRRRRYDFRRFARYRQVPEPRPAAADQHLRRFPDGLWPRYAVSYRLDSVCFPCARNRRGIYRTDPRTEQGRKQVSMPSGFRHGHRPRAALDRRTRARGNRRVAGASAAGRMRRHSWLAPSPLM